MERAFDMTMQDRPMCALIGVGLLALGLTTGCVQPDVSFPFDRRVPPRLFLSHHPILPGPSDELTLRLQPELLPGQTVDQAYADLLDENQQLLERQVCDSADGGAFECRFDLAAFANDTTLHYAGWLETSQGRVSAPRYGLTVGDASGVDERIAVRVPVRPVSQLSDDYRIDLLLVRDPSDGALSVTDFVAAVESVVFDGLLADPAYRWRDDQIGFFLTTRPGVTDGFYSPFDTRCGQNPWPRDSGLPEEVQGMEVVGVLHRRTAAGVLVEGSGAGNGAVDKAQFRDCAGELVRTPDGGTGANATGSFSVVTGRPDTPRIATHEWAHAAFKLSDEYNESADARTPRTMNQFGQRSDCCCVPPQNVPGGRPVGGGGQEVVDTGGVVGGIQLTCVATDGSLVSRASQLVGGEQFPVCAEGLANLPANCGAQSNPIPECVPLLGDCTRDAHWLGEAPDPSLVRNNLFLTEEECEAARVAIAVHPGVEHRDTAMAVCTPHCGVADAPDCPCPTEPGYWRVDRQPLAAAGDPPDLMGAIAGAQIHGGACGWCVETSLCVRWQRALGRTADRARQYCDAPPDSIEDIKEAIAALVAEILRWIRGLLGLARV
jgi:hypothetical protein